MTKRLQLSILALVLCYPQSAFAGMPSIRLSDVMRMRFESLSFFLFCWLMCAWIVKSLWNGQRSLFPNLPAMTYPKACGFLTVWGLLAMLVLTMISGARELLTPGAWEKVGLTYKLAERNPMTAVATPEPVEIRRRRLEKLRSALWAYSASHEGRLPASIDDSDIAAEFWVSDETSGVPFVYIPGRKPHHGSSPLAMEPRLSGQDRFVLFSNGEIRRVKSSDLGSLAVIGGQP